MQPVRRGTVGAPRAARLDRRPQVPIAKFDAPRLSSASMNLLAAAPGQVDSGDTAIVLFSAGLVLLMTPGLAFFYGGLVRAKNVVHTMVLSLVCMALVGVLWALFSYSLAFAPGGSLDRFIGGFCFVGGCGGGGGGGQGPPAPAAPRPLPPFPARVAGVTPPP